MKHRITHSYSPQQFVGQEKSCFDGCKPNEDEWHPEQRHCIVHTTNQQSEIQQQHKIFNAHAHDSKAGHNGSRSQLDDVRHFDNQHQVSRSHVSCNRSIDYQSRLPIDSRRAHDGYECNGSYTRQHQGNSSLVHSQNNFQSQRVSNADANNSSHQVKRNSEKSETPRRPVMVQSSRQAGMLRNILQDRSKVPTDRKHQLMFGTSSMDSLPIHESEKDSKNPVPADIAITSSAKSIADSKAMAETSKPLRQDEDFEIPSLATANSGEANSSSSNCKHVVVRRGQPNVPVNIKEKDLHLVPETRKFFVRRKEQIVLNKASENLQFLCKVSEFGATMPFLQQLNDFVMNVIALKSRDDLCNLRLLLGVCFRPLPHIHTLMSSTA